MGKETESQLVWKQLVTDERTSVNILTTLVQCVIFETTEDTH